MKKSEIVKDLNSSPLYNMSMDSLENFHTSFLCWLGKKYPTPFISLFLKNIKCNKLNNCETQKTHRYKNGDDEKNKSIRTDLEFQFNDKELIVIENKIKSYPNDEQLDKYSSIKDFDKKNTTFILLSLVDKRHLPKPWKYISYSTLAKEMKRTFNKNLKYKEHYHKYLIQDYIKVINLLSKNFPKNSNKKIYDSYEKREECIDDLKDIYIKYRTSELADYINRNISKKYKWEIENNFSANSKEGVIDVIRKLDENSRFQIQIQCKQYSYGFVYLEKESNTKIWKKRLEIANELKEKEYWFVDTKDPKGKTKCKDFHSYKPDFIYRQSNKEIDKNTTYKEIIDRINKDIKNFEKNLVKIQNCISKFVK